MPACALIGYEQVNQRGAQVCALARLSAFSVMDALIRGTHVSGCTRMISLASTQLLFGLGYFYCLQ